MNTVRYRVINSHSTHFGQVGEALDKDEVQERVGNTLGRTASWYAGWSVLLNLSGNKDDVGCGFMLYELEEIDEHILDHPINYERGVEILRKARDIPCEDDDRY